MARRNRRQPKPAEEKDEPRRESKRDLKLIPVAFNESVSLFLNHDGEAADKDPETTGKFSIENTSGKDRIWDVTLALDDTGSTDLDETIEIIDSGKRSHNFTRHPFAAELRQAQADLSNSHSLGFVTHIDELVGQQ